jgi:hypothetical protein
MNFQKGQSLSFKFSLIPVQTGTLFLPNIKVESGNSDVQVKCIYPASEQLIVDPTPSTVAFIAMD